MDLVAVRVRVNARVPTRLARRARLATRGRARTPVWLLTSRARGNASVAARLALRADLAAARVDLHERKRCEERKQEHKREAYANHGSFCGGGEVCCEKGDCWKQRAYWTKSV